jgi:WhiB family redox-sensing transcriptional regulator
MVRAPHVNPNAIQHKKRMTQPCTNHTEPLPAKTAQISDAHLKDNLTNEGARDATIRSDDAWMLRSRCRDMAPEIFFPYNGPGVAAAQRICTECTVRPECLDYALRNQIEQGIWGGTSERERRRIRRGRKSTTN